MMSEMSSSEKPEFCLPMRRGSRTFWVAGKEGRHERAQMLARCRQASKASIGSKA